MKPEEITKSLQELFEQETVQLADTGVWQIETALFRLLVLLSEDLSWLRILIPIAPAQDAEPFFQQLLAANFDETQETRYALNQNVLWGVFQHNLEHLDPQDFVAAIGRLVALRQQGLSNSFDQFADSQIRQIIQASKQQGQTLEATLQTLDRFYQEGLMGDLDQDTESRLQVLGAWRNRLESLWYNEE